MLSIHTRISDASCDAQLLLQQISQNTRDVVPVVVTATSPFYRGGSRRMVWRHTASTPPPPHQPPPGPTVALRFQSALRASGLYDTEVRKVQKIIGDTVAPHRSAASHFERHVVFEANASRCISLRRRHTGLSITESCVALEKTHS